MDKTLTMVRQEVSLAQCLILFLTTQEEQEILCASKSNYFY